jgi:hypothetical protein
MGSGASGTGALLPADELAGGGFPLGGGAHLIGDGSRAKPYRPSGGFIVVRHGSECLME